jgi:cbb3-type cytochrome oxidase maturation protein
VEALLYLIPAALFLGLLGLGGFLWALRNGQFEDLDGAANRVLFDEEPPPRKKTHQE